MGRRKRHTDIIATFGIIVGILFFIYKYYSIVNIDFSVATTLFALLPGFLIVASGIYVVAESNGVGRLGGMMCFGIGFCYLLYAANTQGIITPEMLTGLTIPQIQIWVMIISTLVGSMIYATT